MPKISLKRFLADKNNIANFTSKSQEWYCDTFDMVAEAQRVVESDQSQITDFVADQLSFNVGDKNDIRDLVDMLEQAPITHFQLDRSEIGFALTVYADKARTENTAEIVDRLAETIARAKTDFDNERSRYEQYRELKKEFGDL